MLTTDDAIKIVIYKYAFIMFTKYVLNLLANSEFLNTQLSSSHSMMLIKLKFIDIHIACLQIMMLTPSIFIKTHLE